MKKDPYKKIRRQITIPVAKVFTPKKGKGSYKRKPKSREKDYESSSLCF